MKERKKKASKGEQGKPIQLSLLVSPQFHFKNLSAHPTRVSSPQPSVSGDPPIDEHRARRSQARGTRWLDTYITSLNFSHTDTSTSGTMTPMGDKPVLVGILCPESNFPNLVSPHILLCQACFSGLSQKVNHLAVAGAGGGRTQRKSAGQSFAESVHPSASGSADVSGADRIALGHRRWHRAHSRPVLSGLMQFVLLCPQKRVEGKGLRSREEGPRARGCEESALPHSRQQTWPGITAVARGLPPGGPDGASKSRCSSKEKKHRQPHHGLSRHWPRCCSTLEET